jgi:uncharacterized repeat protein (TIGR01451 family)
MLNRGRFWIALAVSLALVLAVPAAAGADTTLGTVTPPSGAANTACPNSPAGQVLINVTSGGVTGPLSVPSTPGPVAVTQWQVDASSVTSGTQLTLVVLRVNVAAQQIMVVGTDGETVNTANLPANNVATFSLASPIAVQAGDIIGIYSPAASSHFICYWNGGTIASANQVQGLPLPGPPTTGAVLTPTGGGLNVSSSLLNLAATLSPVSFDAGLALTAGPTNAVVGQPAVLTATVTNHGPQAGVITFTDPVPNGLTIQAASIGSGACSTSSVNIVTCTTASLAAGQSTVAVIVVTPTAAQTYTDNGTVSLPSGGNDPNPANNNATTTLTVHQPGAATKCVVPKLRGASVALAKNVLTLLGCKVGKIRKAHSGSVAKGLLVGTAPGAGSYALNKVIVLEVSSGRAAKHKKK